MRIKKRLSIPLLIAAALMVYALVAAPPRLTQDPQPAAVEALIPDAYAEGVSLRSYSENGVLAQRTDAAALQRFAGPGRVELEAPQRWAYDVQGDWYAQSREGELNERRDILKLRGEVRLRFDDGSATFGTEQLTIDLEKRVARSTVGVRAWQEAEGNEIRAERLFANLDRQVAVLTGRVRSVYNPDG